MRILSLGKDGVDRRLLWRSICCESSLAVQRAIPGNAVAWYLTCDQGWPSLCGPDLRLDEAAFLRPFMVLMAGSGEPDQISSYAASRRTLLTRAGRKQARLMPPACRTLG